MIFDEEIKQLNATIKLSKACTGRKPKVLTRRLRTLEFIQLWTIKQKMAETKIRKYKRRLAAYKAWDTMKRGEKGQ